MALVPRFRQAGKFRHSQLLLVLCIFALILLALGIYFGPQTVVYWRLRQFLLIPPDYPPRGWSSVPGPLSDTTSSATGSVLSYYGYNFEAPWEEPKKVRDEGTLIRVRFETRQEITFYNPANFQDNPIRDYPELTFGQDANYFTEAFGPGAQQSKYQQYEDVISTKPSQLSPFRSHKEFARALILLEIKGLWFEHNTAVPDIFSIQTKGFRGFEIRGLSHDWQMVSLNLFDSADHWLTISVEGDARAGVRMTQSDINCIIQSFGRTPSR